MSSDELVYSPLQQRVTRDGHAVDIQIYKSIEEEAWLLEVVDDFGGSTVWDGTFATDREALDAALEAIDEEGIASFSEQDEAPVGLTERWAELITKGALAGIHKTLDETDAMVSFAEACGILAAAHTSPELVPPSKFFGRIIGDHVFDDAASGRAFMEQLLSLYQQVGESLSELDAHCTPPETHHDALALFCRGYLSVAFDDATWQSNPGSAYLIEPIALVAYGDSVSTDSASTDSASTPLASEFQEFGIDEARMMVRPLVAELYDYWRDSRIPPSQTVRRSTRKVGRNEPCPCGSGKKFKRCCANERR